MISVLVIDDSVVVRTALKRSLVQVPEVGSVEVAANGAIGLKKIARFKPDIVILEIEMPEVDGFKVLETLRSEGNDVPVLVFSSVSDRGAKGVLKAMSLGASDFISKSTNGDLRGDTKDRLVPLILALANPTGEPARKSVSVAGLGARLAPRAGINCVVIGASTGGPNALAEVTSAFPADFEVPILIVQHMPPIFTKQLAKRLNETCKLNVVEASDGEVLSPGGVWLAPGGHHMVVRSAEEENQVQIEINSGPREHSCRPSVDPLFRSASGVYGPNMLGVILTGMGSDGLEGCEVIKKGGGQIMTQEKKSCVVWGMPRFVTEAGHADAVVELDGIGFAIVRWVRESRGGESRRTLSA